MPVCALLASRFKTIRSPDRRYDHLRDRLKRVLSTRAVGSFFIGRGGFGLGDLTGAADSSAARRSSFETYREENGLAWEKRQSSDRLPDDNQTFGISETRCPVRMVFPVHHPDGIA